MERVVRWIHVSDWHIPAPLDRDTKDVLTSLISDIRTFVSPDGSRKTKFLPDFLVHSGDIAFSGKATEYTAATSFLKELMEAAKLPLSRLFVVPGNHDVSDDVAVPAESLLIAADEPAYAEAGRMWYDSPVRESVLLRRFENFHTAFAPIVPPEQRSSEKNPYYACRIDAVSGVSVGILGLNSALASQKDDEAMHRPMVLGRWQINDAATQLNSCGKCDFRVAILHHPLEGLTQYDRQQSTNALKSCAVNVILRGHLHTQTSILEVSPDGAVATIAAGSSYEKRWTHNGYVVAEADLSRGVLTLWFRKWEIRLGTFVPDTGAYKGTNPDGSCTLQLFPLPVKIETTTTKKVSPKRLINRHGLVVPQSGLERFGIFAGYVDRESHREIRDKIEFQLLGDRALHNKYLYWHVDSRRLYYDLLQEPHYTIARDSEATFKASLKGLIRHLRTRWKKTGYTFVSLGVGSGVKEKWLLEEVRAQSPSAPTSLLLIDLNSQMLQWAMNEFRMVSDPDFARVLFCHADFDRLRNIDALLPVGDGPIVFLLLGGLFGNQPTEAGLIRSLRQVANHRSYLLMGIQTLDAIAGDPTLGGYGTAAAYRFLDVTLSEFDHPYNRRKHSLAAQSTDSFPSDVSDAETITVRATTPRFGEVELGFSRRYKMKKLAEFLADQHCTVEWESTSPGKTYWKVLARLAPSRER